MTAAIFVLFFSLVGIATLFTLKNWELRANRILFPRMRARADVGAFHLKQILNRTGELMEKLPPFALRMTRIGVHKFALAFAAFARLMEKQAHHVADMVSHKHRFERRTPQNEFLKRVMESRAGSGPIRSK